MSVCNNIQFGRLIINKTYHIHGLKKTSCIYITLYYCSDLHAEEKIAIYTCIYRVLYLEYNTLHCIHNELHVYVYMLHV